MASTFTKQKICINLLVDNSSRKVLFAEARKDFVDFLFGLLELPLGSILALLFQHGVSGSGSLGKIYESVKNLDDDYLVSNQIREFLMRPRIADVAPASNTTNTLLKQFSKQERYNPNPSQHQNFSFQSSGFGPSSTPSFVGSSAPAFSSSPSGFCTSPSLSRSSTTPVFGSSVASSSPSLFGSSIAVASSSPSIFGSSVAYSSPSLFGTSIAVASSSPSIFGSSVASSSPSIFGSSTGSTTVVAAPAAPVVVEGYVKGVVTYMVMDDLVVKPMSNISTICILSSMKAQNLGSVEEKTVEVDLDMGLKLLKASFESSTVLTDVFFPTTRFSSNEN
ncbi:hypothetical protein Vadar_000799 [Vaccinium darrowii]|uniref:Uncharacterized protein n=1 Tax=Vaccinium darrowii TaxID=229202 RepID=A0ACB7X7B4_9ERIC|nr:hypothetical protein Vadar_000799 [Vaccinium darrowii]